MYPIPMMGNVGIALSGLRNYVANLSAELKDKGVYAAHLSLGLFMQAGSGDVTDPDVIADFWYNMYTKKEVNETTLPEGVTPATIIFPKQDGFTAAAFLKNRRANQLAYSFYYHSAVCFVYNKLVGYSLSAQTQRYVLPQIK